MVLTVLSDYSRNGDNDPSQREFGYDFFDEEYMLLMWSHLILGATVFVMSAC